MKLLAALIEQNLAENQTVARGLILSNRVLVNDIPVTSEHQNISAEDVIRVRGVQKYVARSAEKLLYAVQEFEFPVKDLTFLDVGSSTGGFTQVLLDQGARSVLCVDVGYGILHSKIRNDPRVTVFERQDIKQLQRDSLPLIVDSFVCDVSFTSLEFIIPHVFTLLKESQEPRNGLVLFKPQFELPKNKRDLLNRGVLESETEAKKLIDLFVQKMQSMRIELVRSVKTKLKGRTGNQEYVLWLKSI